MRRFITRFTETKHSRNSKRYLRRRYLLRLYLGILPPPLPVNYFRKHSFWCQCPFLAIILIQFDNVNLFLNAVFCLLSSSFPLKKFATRYFINLFEYFYIYVRLFMNDYQYPFKYSNFVLGRLHSLILCGYLHQSCLNKVVKGTIVNRE